MTVGLQWIRVDTQLPTNPKILELAADKHWRAIVTDVFSWCYSGAHETDGFIPTGALPFIHSTPTEARQLVEARLWLPAAGGWEINDWAERQPSSDVAADRRRRAQAAANIRWSKQRKGRTDDSA